MYRSLYAFRSTEPNSLHFSAGESFLILERSNKHWWLGSRSSSGETGYIPASYIEKIQASRTFVPAWQPGARLCLLAAPWGEMKPSFKRRDMVFRMVCVQAQRRLPAQVEDASA